MRGMHLFFALSLLLISGCASFAYTNERLNDAGAMKHSKASFLLSRDRGTQPNTLFLLALSGGGSRAAYWSGGAMLRFQTLFSEEGVDLLKEVDAISSVSGGSLPAAYYAVSRDPEQLPDAGGALRLWQPHRVRKLMGKNYILRWFGNWFWPTNIAKFWFTSFDRSDIMAQTLADNLYDSPWLGRDTKMGELNPERPNLILNATNGTTGQFARPFTFTKDDFAKLLGSDINEYEVSRAVMASAAFPAIFNYMTLRDFRTGNDRSYVHLLDGGSFDNLGLHSLKRLIDENGDRFDRIGIILVDAYTATPGEKPDNSDARTFFDYVVDTNFIDSVDALLSRNRDSTIKDFSLYLEGKKSKKIVFYHATFEDIADTTLRSRLYDIKTNFKIRADQIADIDRALTALFSEENRCLQKIKKLVAEKEVVENDFACRWSG